MANTPFLMENTIHITFKAVNTTWDLKVLATDPNFSDFSAIRKYLLSSLGNNVLISKYNNVNSFQVFFVITLNNAMARYNCSLDLTFVGDSAMFGSL